MFYWSMMFASCESANEYMFVDDQHYHLLHHHRSQQWRLSFGKWKSGIPWEVGKRGSKGGRSYLQEGRLHCYCFCYCSAHNWDRPRDPKVRQEEKTLTTVHNCAKRRSRTLAMSTENALHPSTGGEQGNCYCYCCSYCSCYCPLPGSPAAGLHFMHAAPSLQPLRASGAAPLPCGGRKDARSFSRADACFLGTPRGRAERSRYRV